MPPADSIYRTANGWTFGVKFGFWKDAFKRPSVQNKICFYWARAKNHSSLTEPGINYFLDQKISWISKPVKNSTPIERDCSRYFPNTQCAGQYNAKVALLKKYIKDRLIWMSDNLGDNETVCRANIDKIFSPQQ